MNSSHQGLPSSIFHTPAECRIGLTPETTLSARSLADLHALPAAVHDWQRRHPGSAAAGIISYEAGRQLQGLAERDNNGLPLAVVHLYPACEIVLTSECQAAPGAGFSLEQPFVADASQEAYRSSIARIQAYEAAGDCYQVNYARQFSARARGSALDAFLQLVRRHPAPWASYIQISSDAAVFGVSPECFLRAHDKYIVTEPIKGSRPRGRSAQEDKRLGDDLRHSDKDLAENLMIVDLLRNDLAQVCQPGSVNTPELFALRRFSNVQHLVSTVQGALMEEIHPLAALLSCSPGGSITGAPKRRAMEIIDELEDFQRGFYCGSQFWLDAGGNLDANILIRTFQWLGEKIVCHGGGGIVADSDASTELAESEFKVQALMEALETGAEQVLTEQTL